MMKYFVVYDYELCGLLLQIQWFMIMDSAVYKNIFCGVWLQVYVVYDYKFCGLWLQILWFMITYSVLYDYRLCALWLHIPCFMIADFVVYDCRFCGLLLQILWFIKTNPLVYDNTYVSYVKTHFVVYEPTFLWFMITCLLLMITNYVDRFMTIKFAVYDNRLFGLQQQILYAMTTILSGFW